MKEYGGYIELDTYRLPMLHEGAVALNCGRNCLAYLLEARGIKKILLPYYMCDSVFKICRNYDVEMNFYHIDQYFHPVDIEPSDDMWLYVMNYYGQLTHDYISSLKAKFAHVIIDNAHAYFDVPLTDTDTLYTCRKFFGVTDGAFLYTDCLSETEYPRDESFERMHFILGRFERSASEFYSEYVTNNDMFDSEPIKRMSKLTDNLLHGIDYEFVKCRRSENYHLYHEQLRKINQLALSKTEGAFAYPLLLENGSEIRRKLQKEKIYIPALWPNVINDMAKESLEYRFANNILPLPCDQRYDRACILYIIRKIMEVFK